MNQRVLIVLLACLALCSCSRNVEIESPPGTRSVTAEVVSTDVMHDSFDDRPHEMNTVVKYRISWPSDLAGQEFEMFYPLRNGTNSAPSLGDVISTDIDIALLDDQKKE